MGFFVLGVSYKQCPVEVREKLHFSERLAAEVLQRRQAPVPGTFPELVILSTCNRVELYGFSEESRLPEEKLLQILEKGRDIKRCEFSPFLYHYEGRDAIRHLFRVAAGLDSLVVGENEILGQLRDAFRMAVGAGSAHSLLYRSMEKALKIGKEVRSETRINQGAVSIPSVAVELAQKIFGRLGGEKVMVLGTGEMSALTLKHLNHSGAQALYVVSRSQERGEKLALEFDATWVPLESWPDKLGGVDILIASTSAPHPIVHAEQVAQVMKVRRHRPLFLIDIAVPRDIEPEVNALDNVYLYNIDDLKSVADANLKLRKGEIQAAEAKIEDAVSSFQAWLEQLQARPALERFEKFLDELLDQELSIFARETGLKDDAKLSEIRSRLRAKLLHLPHEKIKEASKNGGVTRYVEALHSLFHLDEEK